MKCYLLTGFVFVFLLTLVKGYNLPFPIGLLAPRTKYDYDLTRFFIGANPSGTSEVVKDYKDSTQVYHSPLRTIETPIRKDEQYDQYHPLHFGSQFNPYDHRSEHARDNFGFYKPLYIKFQHDTPKRPYRPIFGVQNEENIKTGFGSPFPINQNNYFPTTTAPPLPSVPRIPPAPQASWIRPTPIPQGTYFGQDTTKQEGNAEFSNRFGENVQQQDTTKGYGASFGAFAHAEEEPKKDFQPSYQSFNFNDYKAPTAPAPLATFAYEPVETTTTTTTTKPGKLSSALLSSLAGGDFEVKYKETETDYYDFDEEDLKRPQYDISASRKLFDEFVKKYGKTYKDKQDEEVHYQHFIKSLMTVNRLNSEGGSASFDINVMSDEDPKVYGK